MDKKKPSFMDTLSRSTPALQSEKLYTQAQLDEAVREARIDEVQQVQKCEAHVATILGHTIRRLDQLTNQSKAKETDSE